MCAVKLVDTVPAFYNACCAGGFPLRERQLQRIMQSAVCRQARRLKHDLKSEALYRGALPRVHAWWEENERRADATTMGFTLDLDVRTLSRDQLLVLLQRFIDSHCIGNQRHHA